MARNKLPTDVALRDVVPTLKDGEAYVRNMLRHLYDCQRDNVAPWVRLGIMGEGVIPNYRIDYPREEGQPSAIYGAFNGRGHGRIAEEDAVREGHWSVHQTSLVEVAEILGSIRKSGGRRRA